MIKLILVLGIPRKGRQPVPRTIQQTFARRQTITRLCQSLDLVEECHLQAVLSRWQKAGRLRNVFIMFVFELLSIWIEVDYFEHGKDMKCRCKSARQCSWWARKIRGKVVCK